MATTTKDCKDCVCDVYYSKHHHNSRLNMLADILRAEKDDILLIAVAPAAARPGELRFYEGRKVCFRTGTYAKALGIPSAVVIRGQGGLLCTIPFIKIGGYVNFTQKYNITW